MAIRTFKYLSIATAGTPAPVFGTTTTAAIVPPPAPPGTSAGGSNVVNIPVADSSFFLKGDTVLIDVGVNEENSVVYGVPDATHVQVNGFSKNHASGIFVRLGNVVNAVYIQTKDGNVGAIFIGTKSTFNKITGVFMLAKLLQVAAGTQPTELSNVINAFPNPVDTGDFWMDGTNADQLLPSYNAL